MDEIWKFHGSGGWNENRSESPPTGQNIKEEEFNEHGGGIDS